MIAILLLAQSLGFEELLEQGAAHFSNGNFREARPLLEKAAGLRPGAFPARFLLGATLLELHDERSVVELRRAHLLQPGHSDARKLLASTLISRKEHGEAIALLRAGPQDEEAGLLLTEALHASGRRREAFDFAVQAAQRHPRSAALAAWLGFQHQFAGRFEPAKRELRRALAIDPDFAVAAQVLGDVFLKEENYAEAAVWLERAAAAMADDVETLVSLSRAYAESDVTRALAVLSGAPPDARIHLQRSRLYFKLGDTNNAQREAELSHRLREQQPIPFDAPAALRKR